MMSQQVHPALRRQTKPTTLQFRYITHHNSQIRRYSRLPSYAIIRRVRMSVKSIEVFKTWKAMSITFYSIHQVYISYIPYILHIAGRSGFLSSLNKPVGR